jgi:hypothetical protein
MSIEDEQPRSDSWSLRDELLEIENYIKSLEINDNSNKKMEDLIKDGVSKGLVCDFSKDEYRGTMFSTKIIKQEEYNDFQNYINRCRKKQYDEYKKWKNDIINSGVEYSKDELKYNKIGLI